MTRPISLVTDSYLAIPGLDTTLARALLQEVSAGDIGETFRLYSPGRVLAFGKRDAVGPGFAAAAASALSHGYTPLVRLAGGRAAVFHESTLAFGWTLPIANPREGIQARFETVSQLLVKVFARVGVETAIGEIPGEYCPGRFSVHHADRRKVMGVGQRLARNAAHVGGVIVVDGAEQINDVLHPVYGALEVEFDPAATGSLAELSPGLTITAVANAVMSELESVGIVHRSTLSSQVVRRGRELLAEHLVGEPSL